MAESRTGEGLAWERKSMECYPSSEYGSTCFILLHTIRKQPSQGFLWAPTFQKAQLWKPRIFGAPACLLKGLPAVLPPSSISFPISHIHKSDIKDPIFPTIVWLGCSHLARAGGRAGLVPVIACCPELVHLILGWRDGWVLRDPPLTLRKLAGDLVSASDFSSSF